jgi:hypothetical protein
MVICLPDELPRQSLTAHQLDRHFGVSGTLFAGFWATALRPWQRNLMIGLRKGRPACCAGGPIRLLDLAGIRHAAGVGAGLRHQVLTHVVHGTRAATPWPTYLAHHLAEPSRYPMRTALTDFHNQPRVNAVRMHNAVHYGAAQLDLSELEAFQAGLLAYQRCATPAAGPPPLTAWPPTTTPPAYPTDGPCLPSWAPY